MSYEYNGLGELESMILDEIETATANLDQDASLSYDEQDNMTDDELSRYEDKMDWFLDDIKSAKEAIRIKIGRGYILRFQRLYEEFQNDLRREVEEIKSELETKI